MSFQELATRVSHRNTGRASGCPIADQLLARIAADENLHMVFYRNLMAAALDIAPDDSMKAIRDEVVNFAMPGLGMADFAQNAITIAKAGIYDLRVHHDDVVQPVLRFWRIFDRTDFGPEGEKAREELAQFLGVVDERARYYEEKRERVGAACSNSTTATGAEKRVGYHTPGEIRPALILGIEEMLVRNVGVGRDERGWSGMNRVGRWLGAVASAAFVTGGCIAAAGQASADSCADVQVVFARGTFEPPGVGGVGDAFVDALRARTGGKSVDVYAVNYPASLDFATAADGVADASNKVRATVAACPDTKIVLGGFSQGAAVAAYLTEDTVPQGSCCRRASAARFRRRWLITSPRWRCSVSRRAASCR